MENKSRAVKALQFLNVLLNKGSSIYFPELMLENTNRNLMSFNFADIMVNVVGAFHFVGSSGGFGVVFLF